MGIHFVEAWQNKIEIGFCFDPRLTGGRKSVEQMFSDHVPNSLKRLFRRWTTAVSATATSAGKKIANAGSNKLPNPNPENKVKLVKNVTVSKIFFIYFPLSISKMIGLLFKINLNAKFMALFYGFVML